MLPSEAHDLGLATAAEYSERVGWGHSSLEHAVAFADLANVKQLALIHHEPEHSDDQLDESLTMATAARRGGGVIATADGMILEA